MQLTSMFRGVKGRVSRELKAARRNPVPALALAAAAILLLALFGFRHQLDWGNVPTWFAGAFAVVAAGISYNNLKIARENHRIAEHSFQVSRQSFEVSEKSHQESRAAIDDGHAAQARLVVTDCYEQPDGYMLAVTNFSDSIIFDVGLEVYESQHYPTGQKRVRREFDHENEVYERYENQRVLPGASSLTQDYTNLYIPFQYIATFTDARGIRWERRMDEQPIRVLPKD